MIKRFVTYWALPLAMLGFSSVARADIEAPQTVIGTVKTGIKEAESIQHDLNEIQADLRSAAEGVAGPIKDAAKTVNDVKNEAQSNIQAVKDKADAAKNIASDPEGALNTMGGKLPGFMTTVDTNDSGELRDAVKTNYFTQRPKSSVSADGQAEAVNSVEATKEQDEKMAAVQRENFANLYAQAFTIRTNLAKEKSEDKEHKDSREILQNTKEIALRMEERWRRIMIINAALFEFKTTQSSRQFSFVPEEDEDE